LNLSGGKTEWKKTKQPSQSQAPDGKNQLLLLLHLESGRVRECEEKNEGVKYRCTCKKKKEDTTKEGK